MNEILNNFVRDSIVNCRLVDEKALFNLLYRLYIEIEEYTLIDSMLCTNKNFVISYFHVIDKYDKSFFFLDIYNNRNSHFECHKMFDNMLSAVSWSNKIIN